jgi:hypothetical protein
MFCFSWAHSSFFSTPSTDAGGGGEMTSISSRAKQPPREAWSLERLIHERSILLGLALDNSTFRAYSSHLNSYLTFCSLHNLPIDPTPDTLSYFVTFMSHHIQPRSVENYLSGIVNQLEPHFPHVRHSRHSVLVKRTLKGALHSLGRPVQRKDPLLRDDLQRVFNALPHPLTHDDLLWITLLHCGFYGLLRLGELVVSDDPSLREYSKFTLRTSVSISPTTFSFRIQRDKTDTRYEGSNVVIQQMPAESDPLPLFTRFLASRDSKFPLHPLLWLKSDGVPPSRSWFMRRFRLFFSDSFSGHSMRAGGATSLAAAGVAPEHIRSMGRWSSDTWERYVRKNPTLLQTLLFHTHPLHDSPFANANV